MKRNINLMQPNEDLNDSIFTEAQREYILQALANLGQRIGIKGDGLAYKSFNFLDLLKNDTLTYSSNKYIGYLEYNKNEELDQYVAVFGLHDIKLNTDKILENITTSSINNILYFDREFSFTIPVNGIEKYSKGSIISNNDNILTIITVGKIIGYDDDDEFNSMLLYYKYDIINNKIIYAAKVYHLSKDNDSDYFVLLRLTENSEKNTSKYSNLYDLNIRIFNVNVLVDNYKNSFKELFCFANYNNPSFLAFNFLRTEFLDIDNLEGTTIYNTSNSINFDSNSPISIILNNESNTNFYNNVTLELSFDTNQNEFICINDNFEEIISLYKNEYNFSNLEENIFEFNLDITELYKNMFILYNEKFYIENKEQLFKRILCKIYEELDDEYKGRLYIPLNYDINYICNSNDSLNIYYSTDIYILLTNLNEKLDKSLYLGNSKYIIYDYNGIDTVKSYKFEVEYNSYYEDIINNVYIRLIYTMPYVNDAENWNINGENTNIRAVGKDAGNPNIILMYSKDKLNTDDSYVVLNAIKDKDEILKSGFIRKKFKIDPKLFTNLNNQNIYCYAYVPAIVTGNKSIFENSIIVNICDLNCLDEDSFIEYYIGSNIITMWYYDKEDDEFKFTLVTDESGEYALPLGATTNIASILSRNSLSSINTNDIIILNAKLSKLAHESLGINSLHYEILRNKTAIEYNEGETKVPDEEYQYYNNLNAIIEYTDNLKINENTVQYSQNEKYLPDVNSLDTTNILYPKYEIVENYVEGTTEHIKEVIEATLVNEEIISININNNGDVIFSDEIRQKLQDIIVPTTETETVKVSYKTIKNESNENYNEYVFNSNVPTLDLKEVFVRNMNNLNRLNVISLDKDGKSYNAYLGTSYDEYNKSTFHISSINKNINVGSSTLIDEVNRENFNVHDNISVDFNNIYMNPKYVFSSHKSQIVEFINNSNKYGMGTEWLTDELYTGYIDDIDQTDLNKLNDNTVLVQRSNQSYFNINEIRRVGAVAFGKLPDYSFDAVHAPYMRKYLYDDTDFKRFGVCINTIMNHMFNVDISKYDNIRIFHGGNKMIVLGEFEELNINKLKTDIPYFFILLNDEVACERKGMLVTSENLDVTYETYTIGKRVSQEGTTVNVTGINIYVEFGKHNRTGFNYIECNENLELYVSGGTSSEMIINPDVTIPKYFWYCSNIPISLEDIERFNTNRTIDIVINDIDNHDGGWRILTDSLPNTVVPSTQPLDPSDGKTIWEGDGLYNYIIFPVDWSRYEEDGSSYYLVIPEELNVKDTINNIVPYTLVEDHVQLLGHYYKILESQAPWYEFTYTIYKPFEHE